MKKVNKVLMSTVAILLSLVLISTSVLSGVFAKFVETKSAGATVSLKAFGITVTVSAPNGDVEIDTSKTVNDGENVSVTLNSLAMYPGREELGIVKFAFSGTTTVPTNLTIRVDVQSNDKLLVTKSVFPDYLTENQRAYMPMGFRVRTWSADEAFNTANTPYWINAESISALDIKAESEIATDIRTAMATTGGLSLSSATKDTSGTGSYYVTKKFDVNKPIVLIDSRPAIGIGYHWSLDNTTVSYSDEISTYIAEQLNGASAVTVTLTVTLEQDS